jgi:amino acid adenylation domain-containing protein
MTGASTPRQGGLCLHHLFEAQVKLTPSAIAVVDGEDRVTYAELNAQANRLADHLRKRGVGAEIPVGLCVERSVNLVVGLLGILKAGGAYVPIEPGYPGNRTAVILKDTGSRVVVSETRLRESLSSVAEQIVCLDAAEEFEEESAENPDADVAAENLSYILFTSGSTGKPKGVALEHRGAVKLIHWAKEVFTQEELSGALFSTSVCFDLSVFEIFTALSAGGKVIVAQNALSLKGLAAADEVTLINTVPSAFAELLRMRAVPGKVRVANLAGEALAAGLVQSIYENTAIEKVYNLYGPTEDATYSTWALIPRGGEVTIGRPVNGTEVYILNSDRQAVPLGTAGELYLAGDKLARGYFRRPDLTRERFVPNPFSSVPGARMYRTGDVGRLLADGNIQYLGRVDNQVKVRGHRIEPGEVECALLRLRPVETAVVVAKEDHGVQQLVAYVLARADESIDRTELRSQLRATLPSYMVPDVFVVVDALPLTANGKVDRKALPDLERRGVEADAVAPADELERAILDVWKRVLGTEAIGLHDNFFDLGGNSIRAARVIAEMEQVMDREISLSAMFEGATVQSLAELLRHGTKAESVLTTVQAGDGCLPIFAVVSPGEESLGYALLARHMDGEQPVYKLQANSPVPGDRPFTQSELGDLSRQYIEAILSVRPEGPYCFCAMCDGVQIAERMVLDLEAAGQEVGFLAVFDTWVLQHSQVPWLWQIYYYQRRLQELASGGLREKLRATGKAVQRQTRNFRDEGRPAVRSDWREAYWPANFEPRQFHAPVILFKRPQQPFYYVNDPEMGWGARSRSGVEIHEMEFDHSAMLREPYVRTIGEVLAARRRDVDLRLRRPTPKLTAVR